jgi:hypothetical protein
MEMEHKLDISKWARVHAALCMPKWRLKGPPECMGPAVEAKFCTVASCCV